MVISLYFVNNIYFTPLQCRLFVVLYDCVTLILDVYFNSQWLDTCIAMTYMTYLWMIIQIRLKAGSLYFPFPRCVVENYEMLRLLNDVEARLYGWKIVNYTLEWYCIYYRHESHDRLFSISFFIFGSFKIGQIIRWFVLGRGVSRGVHGILAPTARFIILFKPIVVVVY